MPKRKAPVVQAPVADADSSDSASSEPVASPKKGKESSKKADVRGRGRPPLSTEEKAKRESVKATKAVRGRGRPKGSGASAKTKGSKKK